MSVIVTDTDLYDLGSGLYLAEGLATGDVSGGNVSIYLQLPKQITVEFDNMKLSFYSSGGTTPGNILWSLEQYTVGGGTSWTFPLTIGQANAVSVNAFVFAPGIQGVNVPRFSDWQKRVKADPLHIGMTAQNNVSGEVYHAKYLIQTIHQDKAMLERVRGEIIRLLVPHK